MSALRLGAVSYLNTKPLVYGDAQRALYLEPFREPYVHGKQQQRDRLRPFAFHHPRVRAFIEDIAANKFSTLPAITFQIRGGDTLFAYGSDGATTITSPEGRVSIDHRFGRVSGQ
mgnify:CR=1 FL=1